MNEPVFTVTLEYENIESRGSTRLKSVYTLHAKDHPDATSLLALASPPDGKGFSFAHWS